MAGGSGGLIDSNRQAWQVAAELQTQNGTGGNGTACFDESATLDSSG